MLKVEQLQVELGPRGKSVRPVDGISFEVPAGRTLALVGESGCGKSMTALACMRLLPAGGRIAGGSVTLGGEALQDLPETRMREIRGNDLAMIFQEPASSLNPVMTVGDQIGEVLVRHRGLHGQPAWDEAERLLAAVGIPDPLRRLSEYPFQLSGGMKQRVMIAIALAGDPKVLIADEPTTALDVTIQAQVLDLLAELQLGRGMGMLLITHDLGVVSRMAHRVGVMYAGELVETGEREDFFRAPLHPYSRKLFAALPTSAQRGRALETLVGQVPRLGVQQAGCRFADRCQGGGGSGDKSLPTGSSRRRWERGRPALRRRPSPRCIPSRGAGARPADLRSRHCLRRRGRRRYRHSSAWGTCSRKRRKRRRNRRCSVRRVHGPRRKSGRRGSSGRGRSCIRHSCCTCRTFRHLRHRSGSGASSRHRSSGRSGRRDRRHTRRMPRMPDRRSVRRERTFRPDRRSRHSQCISSTCPLRSCRAAPPPRTQKRQRRGRSHS